MRRPPSRTDDPTELWRARALVLRDRINRTLDLHRPNSHGRLRARPNCAECGYPAPCETYRLLNPATEAS